MSDLGSSCMTLIGVKNDRYFALYFAKVLDLLHLGFPRVHATRNLSDIVRWVIGRRNILQRSVAVWVVKALLTIGEITVSIAEIGLIRGEIRQSIATSSWSHLCADATICCSCCSRMRSSSTVEDVHGSGSFWVAGARARSGGGEADPVAVDRSALGEGNPMRRLVVICCYCCVVFVNVVDLVCEWSTKLWVVLFYES